MEKYKPGSGIKSWAEGDRPIEKYIQLGKNYLSESELLAIILRSGTHAKSAIQLAQEVLEGSGNDLSRLYRMEIDELIKYKGIGLTKAVCIGAALELGHRKNHVESKNIVQIKSSSDVHSYISPHLEFLDHEEFWIILLNRNNRILKKERISMGGLSGTVVDPRIIFKKAILCLASGIILCHNHPSGNLQPSQSDIKITKSLKNAGDFLDIKILDHVIVSEKGYFSFADESYL